MNKYKKGDRVIIKKLIPAKTIIDIMDNLIKEEDVRSHDCAWDMDWAFKKLKKALGIE